MIPKDNCRWASNSSYPESQAAPLSFDFPFKWTHARANLFYIYIYISLHPSSLILKQTENAWRRGLQTKKWNFLSISSINSWGDANTNTLPMKSRQVYSSGTSPISSTLQGQTEQTQAFFQPEARKESKTLPFRKQSQYQRTNILLTEHFLTSLITLALLDAQYGPSMKILSNNTWIKHIEKVRTHLWWWPQKTKVRSAKSTDAKEVSPSNFQANKTEHISKEQQRALWPCAISYSGTRTYTSR